MSKTIYVSIGNSDDKLTQRQWSSFCEAVSTEIRRYHSTFHGEWYSLPDSPYQNACFCFDIDAPDHSPILDLREQLSLLAHAFNQESITWAEADTEFLAPA